MSDEKVEFSWENRRSDANSFVGSRKAKRRRKDGRYDIMSPASKVCLVRTVRVMLTKKVRIEHPDVSWTCVQEILQHFRHFILAPVDGVERLAQTALSGEVSPIKCIV
jgi:hypothetical protein